MQRLFAGTPWDRPPTCEGCGKPETECACPKGSVEAPRVPPGKQTARLRAEKRPRGKVVTTITGLDDTGDHLAELAGALKAACGSGGTVKDGRIEVQGDHGATIERVLTERGYRVRRG